MRVPSVRSLPVHIGLVPIALIVLLSSQMLGQANYQAQIRGVVSDASGAVIPNATVTITEVGTNVSQVAKSGQSGDYIVRALRPSNYIVKAEAPGFGGVEKKDVVLAVGPGN